MSFLFRLLATLLLVPLAVLLPANLLRATQDRDFEPLIDNLILYVVLLVLLLPAAAAMAVYGWFVKVRLPLHSEALGYMAVAALSSAAFSTWLDYNDCYFTPHGVGWHWPIWGCLFGSVFGLAFGVVRPRD